MDKGYLIKAIERSEKAYHLYLEDRTYFAAMRILRANEIVYELLEKYYENVADGDTGIVVEYLFHLEDWFAQFHHAAKNISHPTQEFVFERWNGAIGYPKGFINSIKAQV